MVATAIYSVTMVLRKETAFPLCRAMERRWKRNVVSRVSSVIVDGALCRWFKMESRWNKKLISQSSPNWSESFRPSLERKRDSTHWLDPMILRQLAGMCEASGCLSISQTYEWQPLLLLNQLHEQLLIIIIIIIFLNLGRSSRGGRQKFILEIIALMVNHPSGSHQQSSRAAG